MGLGHLDSLDTWRLWARMITERQESRGFRGGCDFGSLAGQLVESDPETRADLAKGYREWAGLFRDGLAAMRDRGDLRPDTDVDALALATLRALQGGLLLSQTLRDVAPLREALTAAVDRIEGFSDQIPAGRGPGS
ncbi:TetR family transcriptional regulator C-terminal domain-containing protein [Streptomyces sp. NPDC092129]|uniref:TetR family transcriptional regulator C-terminal domain-containing protein n=1 Tax=Streptomyces sp. NPDC092129 TaxID=3366010 RepID=UPI00382FC3AD